MSAMQSLAVLIVSAGMLAGCATGGAQQTAASALPADIHPESRSRLPPVRREALDDHGKRVYDSVTDPKRPTLTGIRGPAGIWLHNPRLSEPIREFNRILRNEVPLEPRLRELAILVTAREFDSQFEWAAHEPVALKEGLDPKVLDIVKFRREVSGVNDDEAALIRFGRELFRDKKVRPGTYAEAVRVLGQQGVVNLTALMANYALTAVMLTAFDQQLLPGQKPLLPP